MTYTRPGGFPSKFLAAKILNAHATEILHKGGMHELRILETVAAGFDVEPPLPILYDHFLQRGPQGNHYCFLTESLGCDVHHFQASAPARRLGVHFVKPIIACVINGLIVLHDLDIIQAGT